MTEKDYNPKQKERKSIGKQEAVSMSKAPAKNTQKVKTPIKTDGQDEKQELENKQKTPAKPEDKKTEKKKPAVKVKKELAVVNGASVPVSTKYSMAICKFIKYKKIQDAIADLEQVVAGKKAVPMKGEIPHRKGKGIMSGRFPKRAAEQFIKLLKSLQGNANNHDVENPVIAEAIANMASRPYGRFGRIKRKRTHIKLVVKNKKDIKKKNKIKKKGKK